MSELMGLMWKDFKSTPLLSVVIVRRAKNHQLPKHSIISHGQEIDLLPILAAKHVSDQQQSKNSSSKIFSFARNTCNQAIKRACRATGLPVGTSHSFRAGFMTDAFSQGVPATAIARHTRHKSIRSLSDHDLPDMSDLKKLTEKMMTS